jgi:hypothetical protein
MVSQSIRYIPIDFIKAKIVGLPPEHFENNILLKNPKSVFKGDTLTKTIYKHKNLSIRIFENNKRIEFSGSLHTFYNEGKHNYNDFNFSAFKEALRLLYKDLGIKPQNLYLIHLEWGFNIKPPTLSNYILDRLIQHNSVNKTVSIDCKIEGKYTQFKHSTKILKLYNKGKHFKLNREILRIELKQINWSEYRQKGIITLKDLINSDKKQFLNELLNQWQRVILYDLPNNENNKFIHYQTQTYWDNLRETKSNKSFKYHFDKLNKLNQAIGLNLKNRINSLLQKKGNELQL